MKKTMNELRQTKEYQGIANIHVDGVGTSAADTETIAADGVPLGTRRGKDIAGDEFMLKQAKDLIVNNLQDQFYDIIFQAVADEMSKNYMFRQNNYLTEAGEELFEDAWHEWYREQHSDILYRVLQTLEP
tara:strand:+ start:645 stop:1034 length:390 start_codon:yes stop_codon:yes gene_type:complete